MMRTSRHPASQRFDGMTTPTSTAPELGTELTLRGIVLGILITGVFTAANVYFGLKAGLTFATSIPCLLYTSPSPRDLSTSRMPSSA